MKFKRILALAMAPFMALLALTGIAAGAKALPGTTSTRGMRYWDNFRTVRVKKATVARKISTKGSTCAADYKVTKRKYLKKGWKIKVRFSGTEFGCYLKGHGMKGNWTVLGKKSYKPNLWLKR